MLNDGLPLSILFSDIKGSSKLNEDQAIKFKREIEPRLLKKVVEELKPKNGPMDQEGGPILHYNTWGDAYLFILKSPIDALNISLSLKEFFSKQDFRKENLPQELNIRCSLHAGLIEIGDFEDPIRGGTTRDVVGRNVVVSARIEPITPPGRIWATRVFKDLLKDRLPGNVTFDSLGLKNFSKRWGAQELYDVRYKSDKEFHDNSTLLHNNIDQNYLPFILNKKNGIFGIEKNGSSVNIKKRMDLQVWSDKVNQIKKLLSSSKEEGSVSGIGVAIGIQNFLYDGNVLCAGVRTKSTLDGWNTGFSLAKGAFNTGYKLFKKIDDYEKFLEEKTPQDLFDLVPTTKATKKFVKEGSFIDELITNKAGSQRGIIDIDGSRFVALFFINTSRFFPRIEIGICKCIDISKIPFNGYIAPFGQDSFCANKKEEGNYWLWINDGIIFARSISNERYIPCVEQREKIKNKQAILIKNDVKKYGFPEQYIPLVSDEILGNESVLLSSRPFSSPARSLLDLF